MYKILLEYPNGKQEVRQFQNSDEFQTSSTILWDTRVDGAMPDEITLGGMVKVNGVLQVDAQKYTAYQAMVDSETSAETTKRQQIQTLRQRVKTLAGQSDLTAAEVKEAIMKFIKLMVLKNQLED